ncbi:hypothetical protein B4903_21705 [Yersinia frederiksenii]|nr:hypothetical protein B4903_21705 [Yersinia frederiksenii]
MATSIFNCEMNTRHFHATDNQIYHEFSMPKQDCLCAVQDNMLVRSLYLKYLAYQLLTVLHVMAVSDFTDNIQN